MDQLKSMKEQLIAQVQAQLGNIHQADAHELGAAVDMIKDIATTEYYCSVVKAMEEAEEKAESGNGGTNTYYYTERYMPIEYQRYRGMDRSNGRMYYDGRDMAPHYYDDSRSGQRDSREGRSGTSRRSYMEGKAMHQEKEVQMKELEHYMSELSQDVTEMIQDATPEEKTLLHKKLSALANKIELLNKD